MAVSEDASTPAVATSGGGYTGTSIQTSSTYGSAAFSPPANSVLVAMCVANYASLQGPYPTFTVSDSAGGTWTTGPVISTAATYAKVQIFTRPCVSAPGSITVTFSRGSDTNQAELMLAVRVLDGASTSTPQGASARASSNSNSNLQIAITPTVVGSLIYVVADEAGNTPPIVQSGTTTLASSLDANDGGYLLSGVSSSTTSSLTSQTFGWQVGSGEPWIIAALEIVPSGALAPDVYDTAAAVDAVTVTPAVPLTDAAGASDTLSVAIVGGGVTPALADAAGSYDDLSVVINLPVGLADAAGASDALTVTIGGAPAPTPGTAIKAASPAFIQSQMPRMHVQNLITGQWLHRDVQGITSPLITWALNAADTFTCTLAPPRADMKDATGNPLLTEWRDAIYLEENDEIKFGGILTSSTMTGPQWQLTAAGFAGYATGTPYEGASYTVTKIDALDVVRFIWNWIQAQPGGNIGLKLSTQESGYLLGAQVAAGVTMTVTKAAARGSSSIWVSSAISLTNKEQITINGIPYTTTNVVEDGIGVPTGQVFITPVLGEEHKIGDTVTQVSPMYSYLTSAAKAGQATIAVNAAGAFANGEVIMINGTDQYTVNQILTGSAGNPTGAITLTTNLTKAYAKGTQVMQVRTITPFTLFPYNSTDLGQEISQIQAEAVFDWWESHTWTNAAKAGVAHQLQFGVPRRGVSRGALRFTEGENIVQAVTVTRDGAVYANNVVALGAGSGSAAVTTNVANANTGRLRRSYIYTDQTIYTVQRLAARAQKVLTAMQNIDAVTQAVVINHPNAPFGSFGPGDDIPVQLTLGWRNTTIQSRITQMTQDPTTNLMTLTLARSDSFTYLPATGQAGAL